MDEFFKKSKWTLSVLLMLVVAYGFYNRHREKQAQAEADSRERQAGYERCIAPLDEGYVQGLRPVRDVFDKLAREDASKAFQEARKVCRETYFGGK